MQKLPKALEREPLVDAIFEVRFNRSSPLAEILPGALFSGIDPKPIVERLAAAEIPHPLRVNDPALQFAPLLRLDLGRYFLSVGDRNFVISCKLPYPKWPSFKKAILEITAKIAEVGIIGHVERYSVKYVNLIEASSIAEQLKKIDVSIRLGDFEVADEHISLQIQRNQGDILHIVSIITSVQGQVPDRPAMFGVIVDVDSIRTVDFPNFSEFVASLGAGVEELKLANKSRFFDCLTQATIQEMGPIYE